MKIRASRKKKLKLIEDWMELFPCCRYYNGKDCILEYVSAEDMYNLIEKKRNGKTRKS